jgi:hypothetical protein
MVAGEETGTLSDKAPPWAEHRDEFGKEAGGWLTSVERPREVVSECFYSARSRDGSDVYTFRFHFLTER